MSDKKKWAVQNTVYVEATSYEEAIKKFWRRMRKSKIGGVMDETELPTCFVSEVEQVNSTRGK